MDLRREIRFELKSEGRYRRGQGRAYKVLFQNISESGCQFYDLIGKLGRGDHITIRIGEIGPIDAYVAWSDRRCVGIEFDKPLYPAVLDHIRQTHTRIV